MKMNSLALILVLSVFNGAAAMACNRANPDPLDLTCPATIYLDRVFGSVAYYQNDKLARWVELAHCRSPDVRVRGPASWCAAAMQAQALTGGR